MIQTPKIYLNDTGLLAHTLGSTVDRLKSEGNLWERQFQGDSVRETNPALSIRG